MTLGEYENKFVEQNHNYPRRVLVRTRDKYYINISPIRDCRDVFGWEGKGITFLKLPPNPYPKEVDSDL